VFILIHPVNFACGRKPEHPEKTHDFRQSVDFSHESVVRIEPTIALVVPLFCTCSDDCATKVPLQTMYGSRVILLVCLIYLFKNSMSWRLWCTCFAHAPGHRTVVLQCVWFMDGDDPSCIWSWNGSRAEGFKNVANYSLWQSILLSTFLIYI
jgi:hypothetical protein